MRVALNLATLRGFGSGFVGRSLYRELLAVGGLENVRAWIPSEWGIPSVNGGSRWADEVPPGPLGKLYAENISIRRAIRKWPAQCVFSLGDTSLPWCPVPHLLMVQQAYIAYDKDERDFTMTPRFRVQIALIEKYFELGLPSVTALTVQSEHMKRRLARRWGLDPAKVIVVPSVVEDAPAVSPLITPDNYVFFPATPGQHKNHAVLAGMMAEVRHALPHLRCLLTVIPSEVPGFVRAANRRGVLNAFVFLGTVPSPRVRELMIGASAVVLPSKLESFGLCYYEAMRDGAAIVAADRECAREACGDAALYAPADSGGAFAEHLVRLVETPADRVALRAAARRRYETLRRSWHDVARGYWRILEAMC